MRPLRSISVGAGEMDGGDCMVGSLLLAWKWLSGTEEFGTGDKDGGDGVPPELLRSGVLVAVLRGGLRGRFRSVSLSPDSAKVSMRRSR